MTTDSQASSSVEHVPAAKCDAWFFLAFPDDVSAAAVAESAPSCATAVANHPSGRPWLLGCLPANQVVVHANGPNRLALIGATSATATELGYASDAARSVSDLTVVSRRFAGSYCVLGSLGGRMYCQGSAAGVRRVFHALIGGVRVVCDRADVLAELGTLPLDHDMLALRLVRSLPHPFQETPLWKGVRPVAPEDYLVVHRDGRRWETGSWWCRPEPSLSRAQGAHMLRSALENAVHTRTGSGGLTICDLSGGLDSTPLCFFAAKGPTGVIARTAYNDNPGGREDLDWARIALRSMPGVRRHIIESTDDMPDIFGGLLEMRDRLDEPSQALMAGPRIAQTLRDSAVLGAATHLNGLGGDHLLCGMSAWEHSLFSSRPLMAWRRARAMHAADGYSARITLQELADRRSYRSWLRRSIASALAGARAAELPSLSDWSVRPSLPAWLSTGARGAVATAFADLVGAVEALGRDRAAHMELFALHDAARIVRGCAQFGPRAGVVSDAPLLDDHVVEAILSVRREERVTPVEWKPLMKAAMRGLLPDEFLRRTTNVGGSAQHICGFAAHQNELHMLYEASGVATSGLIDMAALIEATRPDPKVIPPAHLQDTVNAALFLRNQARTTERSSSN